MARTRETLAVDGLSQFLKACALIDPKQQKEVRESFRKSGEVIRRDASRRISPFDQRTAAGYRIRVRQKGIAVQQSLRKTTGRHPGYGGLQMRRALLPAQLANENEMLRDLERAMDDVADYFERVAR